MFVCLGTTFKQEVEQPIGDILYPTILRDPTNQSVPEIQLQALINSCAPVSKINNFSKETKTKITIFFYKKWKEWKLQLVLLSKKLKGVEFTLSFCFKKS